MQSLRPLLPAFAALAILFAAGRSAAEDRRFLTTPGIVLETGARHATCDALTFTKDGKQLLAAGDDKVVRTWPVGPASFADHQSKVFRWPIFREQLGGIHALAVSADERKIAVAGYGMKAGMVAILDRDTGEILHILDKPPTDQVTWVVAFSPGGDTVVYGTEIGEFFAWTPSRGDKPPVKLGEGTPGKANRARFVHFLDGDTILTVTQDGKIREWDIHDDSPTPLRERSFRLGSLLRVVRSPDGRWLAGISELLIQFVLFRRPNPQILSAVLSRVRNRNRPECRIQKSFKHSPRPYQGPDGRVHVLCRCGRNHWRESQCAHPSASQRNLAAV